MSPEFYAIIGVGVSTLGFLSGLLAVIFYLISQVNRRVDRLEDTVTQRMNRLEDAIDRLQEQVTAFGKRLLKLEWMFEAEFRNQPAPSYVEAG